MYKKQLHATNFKLSKSLINYTNDKLDKLDKFFKKNENILIKVKYTVLPHKSFKVVICLDINSEFSDKVTIVEQDMYTALNSAVKSIKNDLHHRSDKLVALRKFNKRIKLDEE